MLRRAFSIVNSRISKANNTKKKSNNGIFGAVSSLLNPRSRHTILTRSGLKPRSKKVSPFAPFVFGSSLCQHRFYAVIEPSTTVDELFPKPIVLDTSLELITQTKRIHRSFSNLFPLIDTKQIIKKTLPEPSDAVYLHKNLIEYLTVAWSNHFSVIISPDMLFYTVLCEIADEILNNPEDYRHLFTTSSEKKIINVETTNVIQIDLNQLIKGIAKEVPVDASIFTANFSSSTVESRLAIQAAFCDAMSVYYNYISTLCGIPRVKVLGMKQDWQTLEHKIHRMRTEVFTRDTNTDMNMRDYLLKVEEQLQRLISLGNDSNFWKEMFALNHCQSGHTDAVEGWINLFYRNHYRTLERGKMIYLGNDYYNYKSHISTVKWHNADTQRHFELKTGLLFSNVVRGDSEDDVKYPWLEPQFSHVIVETDGSGKMTPEQFKKYIDSTLKGRDKQLMEECYKMLKDDPIEFVQGPKLPDFILQLAGRILDLWKSSLKTAEASTQNHFNLLNDPMAIALSYLLGINEDHPAMKSLKEKMIDYLRTNTNIRSVALHHNISSFEPAVFELLTGNSTIEELTVHLLSQESIDKLTHLLLHPNCKLKRLKVLDDEWQYPKLEMNGLAEALVKSSAPLEVIEIGSRKIDQLAYLYKEKKDCI